MRPELALPRGVLGFSTALCGCKAFYAPSVATAAHYLRSRRHRATSPLAALSSTARSKKPKAGEMAPNVGVILGTMTFGWSYSSSSIDENLAGQMLESFFDAGFRDLDTALTYSGGKTEKMLGQLMPPGSDLAAKCGVLATKAGPWEGLAKMSGNGGLSPLGLREKVEASLKSLGREKIDLLYLHAPDSATPIEETLGEVNRLHSEGRIGALGLSNFQAWEVAHIYHTCKAKGYLLPSVYQGMYNAVTRQVEHELLPCLRKLGIAFYVYNPLAGGLLTGKHKRAVGPETGRFKGNKLYSDRFWKDSYFEAADALVGACNELEDTEPADAAMRWLKFHSHLKDGDAGEACVSQNVCVGGERVGGGGWWAVHGCMYGGGGGGRRRRRRRTTTTTRGAFGGLFCSCVYIHVCVYVCVL